MGSSQNTNPLKNSAALQIVALVSSGRIARSATAMKQVSAVTLMSDQIIFATGNGSGASGQKKIAANGG